ncbi:MAG: hypothetical protein HQL97_01125 [Magnetococcales bacterium]|nr:hypothetical protein [Magnetococcales bacterium]
MISGVLGAFDDVYGVSCVRTHTSHHVDCGSSTLTASFSVPAADGTGKAHAMDVMITIKADRAQVTYHGSTETIKFYGDFGVMAARIEDAIDEAGRSIRAWVDEVLG